MPRPKQYTDDATRAAAWRLQQQQEQMKAAEVVRLAERLHQTLKKAAGASDSDAASLVGTTVAETLRNLQRHYQTTQKP
jgi:hypothetical protein